VSNYSKVTSRFWTGSTGRALRGDLAAQVVASYLISSPHANMLGYYYVPVAYIANDTGIPIEGTSQSLQRLCEEGFCRYDTASEVVWVIEMARLQIGESIDSDKDKRAIGVAREYASLPNNPFLKEFFDKYGAAYLIKDGRTFEAPSKPVAVTVAITTAVPATATVAATCSPAARAAATRREREEGMTIPAWTAYSDAYKTRYGVDPTDNRKMRGMMADFIERVPADEAPSIAAFYVRSNRQLYVSSRHCLDLLKRDAEGIRTEWQTGRTVTDTEARQGDRTQANGNVFGKLIQEAEERESHGTE
jgi:hypothetical protein